MRALRKRLIRLVLWLTGWDTEGIPPAEKRYVLIAYPHTSFWDFFLLLSYGMLYDIPLRFMIKDNVFKGPLGWILRSLGGVPINRSSKTNMVEKMVEALRNSEHMVLSVPPEGTRKWVPHWKTGFYYVALQADVPLVLSFIDGPRRRFGVGPMVRLTGNIPKDLARIQEFYGNMRGINPEQTSPIRFKDTEPEKAEIIANEDEIKGSSRS